MLNTYVLTRYIFKLYPVTEGQYHILCNETQLSVLIVFQISSRLLLKSCSLFGDFHLRQSIELVQFILKLFCSFLQLIGLCHKFGTAENSLVAGFF